MTAIEHKKNHPWIKTRYGFGCAYTICKAQPDAKAIAKFEAEEAQRRAIRREIRYAH